MGHLLQKLSAPRFKQVNIVPMEFFRGVDEMLTRVSLGDWKTYLRWQPTHKLAASLSAKLADEDFAFYGKILRGTKEMIPRWRRCVAATDNDLGEALGQVYVRMVFPAEAKARIMKLVDNLTAVLREDIATLDWMTPATREKAITKLQALKVKVGYPDKWRDYSSLKIDRGLTSVIECVQQPSLTEATSLRSGGP